MAKTKADLIEEVSARAKLPHMRAELLVSLVFDCMADAFHRGEGVEIRGSGSFTGSGQPESTWWNLGAL